MRKLNLPSEEIIKAYRDGMVPLEVLSKRYLCCVGSIVNVLRWNNVQIRPKNYGQNYSLCLCKEELKNKYLEGFSISEIAEMCNASSSTVWAHLRNMGVIMRDASESKQLYNLNIHYFETIDSYEKAYWFGFLMADGYNNEGDNTVVLLLKGEDLLALERFKQVIQTAQPIKSKKNKRDPAAPYFELRIYNKKFSQDLAKLGCVQAKSLIVKFPIIDEKYNSSFMLGYFDGNGCITESSTSNGFEIAGGVELIKEYQKILMKECQLNATKLVFKKGIAILRYGGRRQLKRIFDYIYKDKVFCLERKHAKFLDILSSN